MARGLSRFIRLAAWLAPADARADWRREWLAELDAVVAAGSASPWRFVLGAPRHALGLRAAAWQPSLIASDVRFAWRSVVRRPLFALTATATLAIGIGAVTATFAVVYGVLLKPLPYQAPDRLVELFETNPIFGWIEGPIAPGNAISWRERNTVFESMAWYAGSTGRGAGVSDLTLEGDPPKAVHALSVGGNFFDVLGTRPALGRTFMPGEDIPGRTRVAVLSDAFWRSNFGADPTVVGRVIRMNRLPFTVIGIMPASFRFDEAPTDLWVPLLANVSQLREVRRPHSLRVIARLKTGITVDRARAELSAIASALEREHPDTNHVMGVGLGPLDDWFVGRVRRGIVVLFAAIALVLVIACANVANLLLIRVSERARELAVRAAIGATRGRLVRQLLTESLLLAGVGMGLGLVLAEVGLRAFVTLAPAGVPRLYELGLHPMVVAFACGAALLTTVGVGLVPAWRGACEDLRQGLGDGTRTTAAGVHRLRRMLVVAEVALAALLIVGAAMAVRSMRAIVAVDTGFPVTGLVTAKVSLPSARYGKPGLGAAFFESLSDRLRHEPGVTGAGATALLPLEGSSWTGGLYIRGREGWQGHELRHKSVTTGYLEALGLPLLAGRTLAESDSADAPPVVVVNETFARTFFPTGAVGAIVTFDDPTPKTTWTSVVGVVGDERQDSLTAVVVPEVYDSARQSEFSAMRIAVRSSRPSADVVELMRRDVEGLDPQVAIAGAGPFSDQLDRSVTRERAAAGTMAVFAGCALLLAAIGVYGVAAGAMAGRVREIGIRRAFGATGANVVGLIAREEIGAVVAGLVIGGLFAAVLGRVVGSLLFGVSGHDAVSFAIGGSVLLIAGAAACLIPARRALRVDPARTLRE